MSIRQGNRHGVYFSALPPLGPLDGCTPSKPALPSSPAGMAVAGGPTTESRYTVSPCEPALHNIFLVGAWR